jgi:hypothetical protein
VNLSKCESPKLLPGSEYTDIIETKKITASPMERHQKAPTIPCYEKQRTKNRMGDVKKQVVKARIP